MSHNFRIRAFLALVWKIQPFLRARRMKQFLELLDVKPGSRIIDLGGGTIIWDNVNIPLQITIVNVPGAWMGQERPSLHNFTFVEGDATSVSMFNDNSFDIVFSNSCIEHVGSFEKRLAFANEVRRLAPRYFVETPSIYFPLEVHTGLLFWWYYPSLLRQAFIRRWRKTVPAWSDMIEGTTVVSLRELRQIFPDGEIMRERFFGITKAYIMYRR